MAGPKGKPAAGMGSDEMKFITMKVLEENPHQMQSYQQN